MQLIDRPTTADSITTHVEKVREALAPISGDLVSRIVDLIIEAQRDGRHVYVLGNGGSAATASHLACDLSKATVVSGRRRLRVTALSDNVALLTAWANDTSFDRLDFRHEFEFGLADNFDLAVYLPSWNYQDSAERSGTHFGSVDGRHHCNTGAGGVGYLKAGSECTFLRGSRKTEAEEWGRSPQYEGAQIANSICFIGIKLRRCCAQGPRRSSAARCAGVP